MTVSFNPMSTSTAGAHAASTDPAPMHAIERGDTLPALAARYGTSSDALLALNPQLASPHALYPGDVLRLPADAATGTTANALQDPRSPGIHVPSPCGPDTWIDQIRRVIELMTYLEQAGAESPTLARIIAQAQRDGVQVTVLSDCEYAARFGGTVGITMSDGHVYVPESAVRNGGTGALEHELVHGILFKHPELFDKSIPLEQRLESARALFSGMGMDPNDGVRLVKAFERNGESHHVQTRVTGVDIARERKGLPPLTPQQRDALYKAVSDREAALNVQRWIQGEIAKGRDPATVYAEAEQRWAATGVGAGHPPSGATPQERRASLDALLDGYADESKVKAFEG